MKILSVELTNFGPFHGTHRFEMADRGLLLVMGDNQDEPRMDSNGSGKSHIFDGLDWCAWGENPRGDHAEAQFNDEAYGERGAKMQVKTALEADDGTAIVITRSRTKSKYELALEVGGEDKSSLDKGETQKAIEKYLGLDRDVFHAAVLFGQTDLVHYADATDGDRMEILTKILQLDEIDVYLDRAKAKVKGASEKRAQLQADLASLDGRLQATQPEQYDAHIQDWEQTRNDEVERLQFAIGNWEKDMADAQAQIGDPASLQVRKQALDAELAVLVAPVEGPEIEQARLAAEQAQQAAAVGAQECVRMENQLVHMQNQQVGVCSQCGQPVTAEHLQNEVQRAREALQEAANRQEPIRRQVIEAEGARKAAKEVFYATYRKYEAAKAEKMQESAKIDADLRVVTGIQARMSRLSQELLSMRARLEEQRTAINPFHARKAEVERERYELERRRGQVAYEVEALQADSRYLEFWVQAFGPKGLKSYILDSRLQELSDAANEWLGLLTGGTVWVRFEAEKVTRGKKVVNAPDVRVFRWNPDGTITERSYRSWSGGEKKRISFAIDFGLSRLVARRAKQTYDLLILDEAFKHLDRSGKEAVVEMLQVLGREKSSLIVVEHDSEFQGQFEQRVLVTKRNRRSTIKELDHGEGQEKEGVSVDISADPHRKRPRRQPVRGPAH